MSKTTKMLLLESHHGRTLEEILRDRIESGQTWDDIATDLKVTRATLYHWMRDLGGKIVTRRSVRFASDEAGA